MSNIMSLKYHRRKLLIDKIMAEYNCAMAAMNIDKARELQDQLVNIYCEVKNEH